MINLTIQEACKRLDLGADKVRQLSNQFCQPLGITVFGYVRVYHNGCISWLTSNPDQDRFLVESSSINEDPLVNTADGLKEGHYLWFNDRQFPGCESFYRDRAKHFQMDHGLALIRHQQDYLESFCFSGLLAKKPLYNLFINEKELFSTFVEHFTSQLDRRLLNILAEGVTIAEMKEVYGKDSAKESLRATEQSTSLVAACGWKNLLLLSAREKQCLILLRKGHTLQAIGEQLNLSARTVEHYIESVKNKLCLETRAELFLAAEKLVQLSL